MEEDEEASIVVVVICKTISATTILLLLPLLSEHHEVRAQAAVVVLAVLRRATRRRRAFPGAAVLLPSYWSGSRVLVPRIHSVVRREGLDIVGGSSRCCYCVAAADQVARDHDEGHP